MDRHRIVFALAFGCASLPAQAQCVGWDERFHTNGVISQVLAQTIYDDGSGPALIVGGNLVAAGDALAGRIARWDGSNWSALAGGVGLDGLANYVLALAVYDEGAGDVLFVGGEFASVDSGLAAQSLARWNGASWSALPAQFESGARVNDLLVWDDGSGPALFVAGKFATAGGMPVNHVAKWDGASWTSLAGGMTSTGASVIALELFDDGTGVALYAGGGFSLAGGTPVSHLAKWNGTGWSDVGGGCNAAVLSLGVFDDGNGDELYLSGHFTLAGGASANRIAKWDGTSFHAFGVGITAGSPVADFEVYDDGQGAALYAGGGFDSIAGVQARDIARWDGVAWSALPQTTDGSISSLQVFDSGAGARLFAGGYWTFVGNDDRPALAAWDGAQWSSAVPHGLGRGGYSSSESFTFDDGGGPVILYSHWSNNVSRLQRFDGTAWTHWATVDQTISAYELYDDGVNGPQLYIAGTFTSVSGVSAYHIARWTGTTWSSVGGGITGGQQWVQDLISFDDGSGPALYACGRFTLAGQQPAEKVARWNGTSWSAVGGGVTGAIGNDHGAKVLAIYDEGAGPRLFIGGAFTSAGASAISCLARWNGASWEDVGGGLNGPVNDLAVFDDGNGAALFAVGSFTLAGSTPVQRVARWNGASWSDVGGGTNDPPTRVTAFDDGSGAQLYVAGNYFLTAAGGVPVQRIARWNGSAWSDVDGGFNGSVTALDVHDDPSGMGPSLWVAGNFYVAGGMPASNFARYGRTWPCVTSYCSAGTSSNGCVPSMSATGSPSASLATPFVVSASRVEGQKLGLIFYGLSGASASPWGATSSLLCVKPPQQRMSQSSSGGTSGACDGSLDADWNAYHAAHPGALGSPFSAGASIWLQGWYRDPPSSKTTALTDALEALVGP